MHQLTELTEEDLVFLAAARKTVSDLLQSHSGGVDVTPIDLTVLQQLLDQGSVAPGETYKLQCIGVVFGDLLCQRSRFEWRIINDDYGRDPTLAYSGKALNLNALTLISKRFEKGEEVDLAGLAAWALERAETAEAAEIH